MTAPFIAKIDGVDYGPAGLNIVMANGGISAEASGVDKIGAGTIKLTFPAAAGYTFTPTREVQIYKPGATAQGFFGGFIKHEGVTVYKSPSGQTYVDLQCQDYNVLLDTIMLSAAPASGVTVAAGTFPTQIAATVLAFQKNGHVSVSKTIDATNFVSNIVGSHVFPSTYIKSGSSLRQGLRQLMALAQAFNTALRPRFFLQLGSDGAGGVVCALVVYDGVAPPSSVATFSETPSGAEKSIVSHERIFDASMPLENFMQSVWRPKGTASPVPWQPLHAYPLYFRVYATPLDGHQYYAKVAGTSGATQPTFDTGAGHTTLDPDAAGVWWEEEALGAEGLSVITSAGVTSGATYYHQYQNDGIGPGAASGYWKTAPTEDTRSGSIEGAQSALDILREQKEYPRETFRVVEDDNFVRPGNAVHVHTTNVNADYEVTAVSVSLIPVADPAVVRVRYTLTCGLPLLELFDDGTTGLTAAPTIDDNVPPDPPASLVVSSNIYNQQLRQTQIGLTIGSSPSLDTVGYDIIYEAGINHLFNVGANLTPTILVPPGEHFVVWAIAYDRRHNYSFPSIVRTGTSSNVPPKPHKPVLDHPVVGGLGPSWIGYFAEIVVNKFSGGDDASHGGWIYYQATDGGPKRPIQPVRIPAGATFPYTTRVGNLVPLITYTFAATIIDAYDQESDASDSETYLVRAVPKVGETGTDWSESSLENDISGWAFTTPAGCAVSRSTTDADVHAGGAALVFSFT